MILWYSHHYLQETHWQNKRYFHHFQLLYLLSELVIMTKSIPKTHLLSRQVHRHLHKNLNTHYFHHLHTLFVIVLDHVLL